MKTICWAAPICAATVLIGGGIAPAIAIAQTDTATVVTSQPTSEADYVAFRAFLDELDFFDLLKGTLVRSPATGDSLKDLTDAQRAIFVTRYDQELTARREDIMTVMARSMLAYFNHDEARRLMALSGQPFMATMHRVITAYFSGDRNVLTELNSDPASPSISADDLILFKHFVQTIYPSLSNHNAPMKAAAVAALASTRAAK